MLSATRHLLNAHISDCRDDRSRTAEAFRTFAAAQDRLASAIEDRHQQNRASIRGIYALLWTAIGSILLLLVTLSGFLAVKVLHI